MRKEYTLTKSINGYVAGTTLKLECYKKDKVYYPVDAQWRRVLKDSKVDGCMQLIKKEQFKTSSQKKIKNEDKNL